MNPTLRRLLITVSVLGLACSVVLLTILGRAQRQQSAQAPTPAAQAPGTPTAETSPAESSPTRTPPAAAELPPPTPLTGVHVKPAIAAALPAAIGSLDPRQAPMLLEFSAAGAGLERITLSEFWQTAAQSRQARAHYEGLAHGDANPPPLPDPSGRYVLQTALPFRWFNAAVGQWQEATIPQLAAHSVVINGQQVGLLSGWTETGPGVFETTLADESDKPVARITRRFTLGDDYDLVLEQSVGNLTDGTLQVQWVQYGPGDLIEDRARYMDRRRIRIGYLPDAARFPDLVSSADNDLLIERADVLKRVKKAGKATDAARYRELLTIWPDAKGIERGYELSWFAATNRYFALAVFPPLDVTPSGAVTGSRALAPTVTEIRTEVSGDPDAEQHVFTSLYSDPVMVEAGGETRFDLGVYAGPLDRRVLSSKQPMAALQMRGLILYQMSSMCAVCTFQWLAILLLRFLDLVDIVTLDWGISIILLVIVVRTLLHPLTKRAQINMQRFGKVMTELKPEIEKLQKKYPDDPRKLQQEQMKLMRERGANPLQMLGCLPMVLQMPIWVALYAMLYFAFELRHEPAFWGFFQVFWDWPFLADLSAADHCFGEFAQPFRFFMWNVTGINLLPILLGVVFFIQQKYMSPPPSASMTPEQAQQQKIMRVMMVVLFPLMLYSAPSGLTLYICTSSFIGIVESKYVRAHIKAMDLEPPKPKKKKKPRDLQARAYASALERAKQKRQPPPKKYKKRR